MKIGDYVWFNMHDEILASDHAPERPEDSAGKIIKITDDYGSSGYYKIFWVARIESLNPVRQSIPLYGIPDEKLKLISDEEAMLLMLEN